MSGGIEKDREYQKQWYLKNKDKVKERAKTWRVVNKDRYLSYNNKWKEAHSDIVKESNKRWAISNLEKRNQIQQRYRKEQPFRALYHSLKTRAKEADLPFNVTPEYLESLPKPSVCPALGITIDGLTIDTRLELDKIIPELGYTIGNVGFISGRANRIKSDATVDELLSIAYYTQSQIETAEEMFTDE